MIDFSARELMSLIRGQIEPENFTIGIIKLWEDYLIIPLEEVVDIALFNRATGKYFDLVSDFTFKERLNLLAETCNGFVHMAGGLGCRITDCKITQIRIRNKYLTSFNAVTKYEIEKYHGDPEKELIEDIAYAWDIVIESYVSVYKNASLYFFFDPERWTLKEIGIGNVDKTCFSLK